jgi:hypothetical protein
MNEGHFINRDARAVAHDLNTGDAASAAALLREDCANMNPREFSMLVRQASRDDGIRDLADLQIQRDGDVVVESRDGRRYHAGRLPREEAARLLPPPVEICQPPIVHRPPVVIVERPPVVIIDNGHDHGRPPQRGYEQPRPLDRNYPRQQDGHSDAVIGALGGAVIGGVIGDGKGKNGALKGAVVGGVAGGLLGHVVDDLKKR